MLIKKNSGYLYFCCLSLLLFLVGCSIIAKPLAVEKLTISESEARAVLDEVVKATTPDKTVEELCAPSSSPSICEDEFDRAGGKDAIPTDPPTIVGSRMTSSQIVGNAVTVPGYVIEVEGVNGLGEKYQGEFLVYGGEDSHTRLKPHNTIFWSVLTFGSYSDQ